MVVAGGLAGAAWALIPGFLRAFANTNEIITSLMLNYVAALFLNYLIFDTLSYWRDTSSPGAAQFPQGKALPDAASWPTFGLGTSLVIPFGLLVGVVLAAVVAVLYGRTRFGFEAAVIGDSPRAARYAGMRTRRNILLVMALSGCSPAWAARARTATSATCSTRAGSSSPATATAASSSRRWRATTRSPSCSSRS